MRTRGENGSFYRHNVSVVTFKNFTPNTSLLKLIHILDVFHRIGNSIRFAHYKVWEQLCSLHYMELTPIPGFHSSFCDSCTNWYNQLTEHWISLGNSRHSSYFMEPAASLPCSQEPCARNDHTQIQPTYNYLMSLSSFILPPTPKASNFLPSRFSVEIAFPLIPIQNPARFTSY